MFSSPFTLFFGKQGATRVACAVRWLSLGLGASVIVSAQSPSSGKPNFNGIWQAITTANWDIEPHGPSKGRVIVLGAEDATPPGQGIVEGGRIPYLPDAVARKQKNYE